MEQPYKVAPDIDVIGSYAPVPGMGILPINAFVIKASEPVLVDTGHVLEKAGFMEALRSVIDPADLKWIWLTHTDFDHIGSLHQLLDEAPQVRVITNFLSVGKMSIYNPLPMNRVYFLNPGEKISVGDRTLTAVKPPTFDAPETTGVYDDKSNAFFSSDCFGSILSSPAQDAADIPQQDLRDGQVLWASVDSPWLYTVDEGKFAKGLDTVRQMSPELILSSHVPPARGMTEQFLGSLAATPKAQPFVGPDQAALEAMLAQMTGGVAPQGQPA
jgi:flavorubredoxin